MDGFSFDNRKMTNLLENKHRKEKWKEANFVESLFPRAIPDVSDFLKI